MPPHGWLGEAVPCRTCRWQHTPTRRRPGSREQQAAPARALGLDWAGWGEAGVSRVPVQPVPGKKRLPEPRSQALRFLS